MFLLNRGSRYPKMVLFKIYNYMIWRMSFSYFYGSLTVRIDNGHLSIFNFLNKLRILRVKGL